MKEITNGSLPDDYNLYQNYPNPFNPVTTIKYNLPEVKTENVSFLHPVGNFGGKLTVELNVYDALGIEVITLVNDYQRPGNYEITFDASSLSSGIYFYRLNAGSFTQTKKCLLLQ